MLPLERIARAEYAFDSASAEREETPFGTFYFNATSPTRVHSAGLQFTCCAEGNVGAFLEALNAHSERHNWSNRWIAGCDPASFRTLAEGLSPHGFESEVYWALERRFTSSRVSAAEVEVRITAPGEQDGFRCVHLEDGNDEGGIAYAHAMLAALNGLEAVAYLNGEPVSAGGMYVFGGVTRFTRIVTREAY